mgnify:CR=1 FL=1
MDDDFGFDYFGDEDRPQYEEERLVDDTGPYGGDEEPGEYEEEKKEGDFDYGDFKRIKGGEAKKGAPKEKKQVKDDEEKTRDEAYAIIAHTAPFNTLSRDTRDLILSKVSDIDNLQNYHLLTLIGVFTAKVLRQNLYDRDTFESFRLKWLPNSKEPDILRYYNFVTSLEK